MLPLPGQPALSPNVKSSYRVTTIQDYSTTLLWLLCFQIKAWINASIFWSAKRQKNRVQLYKKTFLSLFSCSIQCYVIGSKLQVHSYLRLKDRSMPKNGEVLSHLERKTSLKTWNSPRQGNASPLQIRFMNKSTLIF